MEFFGLAKLIEQFLAALGIAMKLVSFIGESRWRALGAAFSVAGMLFVSTSLRMAPAMTSSVPSSTSISAATATSQPGGILVNMETAGGSYSCVRRAYEIGIAPLQNCWRYVRSYRDGRLYEALKHEAEGIEWIGPRDLVQPVGQWRNGIKADEWFDWADRAKPVRFCIAFMARATLREETVYLKQGCYIWRRGAFIISRF